MIRSKSETYFDTALSNARLKVSQQTRNGRTSMPFSQGSFADHSTDINNSDDLFGSNQHNIGGV